MGILEDLKILLAEDNKVNQRLAALTFKQMGLNYDIAVNGMQAFEKHQQNEYDLIFMDMQMPVMDGLESTRLIRTFEKDSDRKHRAFIVALTANEISEKKEACIDAGMDDFMEKPFQVKLLRQLILRSFI